MHDDLVVEGSRLASEGAALVSKLRKRDKALHDSHLAAIGRLRAANEVITALRADVLVFDEQRHACFIKLSVPSWDRASHFHHCAFEHYRGGGYRQSARITDVATLFPNYLRIQAIAMQTAQVPLLLTKRISLAEVILRETAADVEAIAIECQTKANQTDMMHSRVVELHQRLSSIAHRTDTKRQGYLDIKRRYMQALRRPVADVVSDAFERTIDIAIDSMGMYPGVHRDDDNDNDDVMNEATRQWTAAYNDVSRRMQEERIVSVAARQLILPADSRSDGQVVDPDR